MKQNLVFLSINQSGYSRTWTYFNGIAQFRKNTFFVELNQNNLIRDLRNVRLKFPKGTFFVVASPCQYIVPIATLLLKERIYLDAGWSLFEGTYLSRKRIGFLGYAVVKNFLIDFLASHLAKIIFLETSNQRKFYSRLLLIRSKKLFVIYTGVDEGEFTADVNFSGKENKKPVIFFRGKFNPESGLDVLAEVSHMLIESNLEFLIYCPNLPNSIAFAANTTIEKGFYTKQEIALAQVKSFLTLGQLSNHPRLARTIPHKAFEAAYLGKPYLTSRTDGIRELFQEDVDVSCFIGDDPIDLASKILLLVENLESTVSLGKHMKETYSTKCSQKRLAQQLLSAIGIEVDYKGQN